MDNSDLLCLNQMLALQLEVRLNSSPILWTKCREMISLGKIEVWLPDKDIVGSR